jgi:glutamyl-tRNA reductase
MLRDELNRLMQAALSLAKRVRSTTRIGEGAVSAAAAAVKVAQSIHGDLGCARALLVGLSEVGWGIAEQLQRAGIGTLNLTGPARRTEREAVRRGLSYQEWDRLEYALSQADITILATGRGSYIIDVERMNRILSIRRQRPVLLVDVAIPPDVDPAVHDCDNAFHYTLSDIESLAEKGQLDRTAEAGEAWEMVESAVIDWRRSLAEREGLPGLIALREHFERVREDVLVRHPNADPVEITRLLVNRLLHEPSEQLRAIASDGAEADLRDTITINRTLERIFSLNLNRGES